MKKPPPGPREPGGGFVGKPRAPAARVGELEKFLTPRGACGSAEHGVYWRRQHRVGGISVKKTVFSLILTAFTGLSLLAVSVFMFY